MVSATSDSFILPKLFTHCTYPLRTNPGCADAARASEQWLLNGAKFSASKREEFFGLKAGELAASCFPHAHPYRLRVCCDVINYLFNLVHWIREFGSLDLFSVADCVLDAMVDPEGYKTNRIAGIMAKEYVDRHISLELGLTSPPPFVVSSVHSVLLLVGTVPDGSSTRWRCTSMHNV